MGNIIISLKKLLGLYKGEFEVVFSKSGVWNVSYSGDKTYNEYCHSDILYNEYTGKYILKSRGYNSESHTLYGEIFKYMRMLNEGLAYIKGGEIYTYSSKDDNKTNGKNIDTMNETECNAYLNKAIEEEDYELAEKIKRRLKELKQ